MARIWPFTYFTQKTVDAGAPRKLAANRKTLHFRFNGRRYLGETGDTLAAALLANGRSVMGWSAHYHRARGIDAPVRLIRPGRLPITAPAQDIELYDGLIAQSAFWPFPVSLNWRWLAERAVRRLPGKHQGTGRPKKSVSSELAIEHLYLYTDLLVVGSGPAGLTRALAAAREGRQVIIVEQDFIIGGSLLYDAAPIDGMSAVTWRQAAVEQLSALPHVQILMRTKALSRDGEAHIFCRERVQPPPGRFNSLLPEQRDIDITAREIAFEAGKEKNSFIFRNNDLPGIVHVREAQSLLIRHDVAPGRNVVLYCNHDAAYKFAAAARDHDLSLVAIVDVRRELPDHCHQFARQAGIPLYPNHEIIAAQGLFTLRRVILRKRGDDPLDRKILLTCDALVQSADMTGEVPMPAAAGFGKCFAETERERLYTRGLPPLVTYDRALPHRAPGDLAREKLSPLRRSPLYGVSEKAGGQIRTRAGWRMADHYPLDRETPVTAARREALAAREKAALSDLSDYGKFHIEGPDAASFLAALIPLPGGKELPVGGLHRCFAISPEGWTIAEVYCWRKGEGEYLLTCHSSFSGALFDVMKKFFETNNYPKMMMRDVSEDQAAFLLAGPGADALLARALPISVMDNPLSHMAFRPLTQEGVPFILARFDLTGGPAYGILTGAGHGDILFNLLREAGQRQGLTLAGVAAREILRIEAGALSAAEMAGTEREDIPELVGLRAVSTAAEGGSAGRLKVGMLLYEGDGREPSGKGIGKITSATSSPLFEGYIALARLADGHARIGSLIRAMDRETATLVDVKVGPPRAYPPGKERGHG